jgi:ubiquinone/menaquinone biosynthesis C-methylase UbiE
MDVASLFRCPQCHGSELILQSKQITCTNGSCGYCCPGRHGYYDFMTAGLNRRVASTTEQRLMESELVARVYERMWRPTFVRMMAGKGAEAITGGFAGEFFIHKNALSMDEREGPWLDLSCGPGTFTRAMASASPGSWVVGLDIARSMVEVAAAKGRGYDNLVFVRGDAHDLPIADASMSGVNNAGALHVYDDPEAVFTEIRRVLKPDGLFVGSTFSPAKSIVGRTLAQVSGIRRFRPSELRAWLSRLGFADYEELRLGRSFVFKVRKP